MDQEDTPYRLLERHEESQLIGLPYPVVFVNSIKEYIDIGDGTPALEYPNPDELSVLLALVLCFLPVRLIGAEARFIRRVMGMRGKDLAAALDLTPETLSRAEHGKKDISPRFDKMLRMAAVLCLQDRAHRVGGEPKAVVSLHPAPREPGSWPVIEAHYVQLNRETMGWDVRLEEIRSAPVESIED